MEKRYQVFVSSTYTDLIEERKEVTQAILKCNCFPAGMELFPASSEKQWTIIKKVIDDSDFYLLIIAGRYGSLGIDEKGKKIGYTEMEFDYALKTGKPIIAFIHNNPEILQSKFVEKSNSGIQRLAKFREKASTGRMVMYWNNKDQLHGAVLDSLHKVMKEENHAIGWVRANVIVESKPTKDKHSKTEEISETISELMTMKTDVDRINFIKSIAYSQIKELFTNNNFVSYFIKFIDSTKQHYVIENAIDLVPYSSLKYDIANLLLTNNIITSFNELCDNFNQNTNSDFLIYAIRLLINLKEFHSMYAIKIFNLLKSNPDNIQLKTYCFNYCVSMGDGYYENRNICKQIIDYVIYEFDNSNRHISQQHLIHLFVSKIRFDQIDDFTLFYNFFFNNNKAIKKCMVDNMFNFFDTNFCIYIPEIIRMFWKICDEVYSWQNNEYTSKLLEFCLFTRTEDIYTIEEIFEKVQNFNDDVFYTFIWEIRSGEFIHGHINECYELSEDEIERIRKTIKARNHHREKKLLELF